MHAEHELKDLTCFVSFTLKRQERRFCKALDCCSVRERKPASFGKVGFLGSYSR